MARLPFSWKNGIASFSAALSAKKGAALTTLLSVFMFFFWAPPSPSFPPSVHGRLSSPSFSKFMTRRTFGFAPGRFLREIFPLVETLSRKDRQCRSPPSFPILFQSYSPSRAPLPVLRVLPEPVPPLPFFLCRGCDDQERLFSLLVSLPSLSSSFFNKPPPPLFFIEGNVLFSE